MGVGAAVVAVGEVGFVGLEEVVDLLGGLLDTESVLFLLTGVDLALLSFPLVVVDIWACIQERRYLCGGGCSCPGCFSGRAASTCWHYSS